VKPGEEAYAIVPVPAKPDAPGVPAVAPPPAPKRAAGPDVVDWMVSALQRVF
jgi:hypothetical protein